MQSFSELSSKFEEQFNGRHFPESPDKLYDAASYILSLGGKRIRPICVLMVNELFSEIDKDGFHVANSIELFHNFSLIHDDIMDKAPLRRGKPTVHKKFNDSTALLAGDVMLVQAYEELNSIKGNYIHELLSLFNKTAKEVCEGQQLDLNFEAKEFVSLDEYVEMISLKTSVLIGCAMQMGAILGGAGLGNQEHLYNFGKYLGIAFQVQDDYLDAFGNPDKFGKLIGGDIIANKKTFLFLHAIEVANEEDKKELLNLYSLEEVNEKVEKVLKIYKRCNVDDWANMLKEKYLEKALYHLEETAVISKRKKELFNFAKSLMERDF